ncbi:MAG: type I secretion system permease/ATPase, partial [Gammaproteobacteria bacterium]|nr:type I secretion system permease/ATPase [Gammaproteobacteria bacterium]
MTVQHHYDPLLECLAIFARRYHRPISIDSLIYGIPVKPGASGPELFSLENPKGLFSRVAKRAGFASRLTQRPLVDIPDLLLPCIIVLHDRKACILENIDKLSGQAKVIIPEVGEGEVWLELEKLEEQYTGYAFLLKREYQATDRHASPLQKLREHHWFWGTLERVKGTYGSVILASIMINLFVLATPLFTMNVYDRVVPNNAVETLWVLAIGVAIVYLLDTVLRFIRNYLLDMAGKKTDIIMSSILFSQVMNLKMDQWPDSVGAFANKMSQFESIRSFLTASTLLVIVDLPFALLFLFVITYIGGPLVAVPLITMALLLIHGMLVVRPMRKSIEQVFSASAQKNSILVESLHAIKTFKTLGATQYAQWSWEESTGDIAKHSLKTKGLASSIGVTTNLLVQLNSVGIVMLGFYQIMDLKLTLGGLIAVMILSGRTISPMSQVASLITNYQQTRTAYDALNDLMQMDVERPDDTNYVRRPDFQGKIEFNNVSLQYPGSETSALSALNLKINPGEHVALLGRVGSGKTSIINLLMGLYTPTKGSLTFDDIEANQLDPADIRHNIAFLSQDVELLRASIRENIVMKDPQAEDEDVLKASLIAGVDLFVNRLPKGYDSPIGEQGHGISGGQRQSVGLARALLLNEPILI